MENGIRVGKTDSIQARRNVRKTTDSGIGTQVNMETTSDNNTILADPINSNMLKTTSWGAQTL